MSRVSKLTHKGTPIVVIDLTELKPGEFKAFFDEATQVLVAAPLGTLRVVTNVEGARFDPSTITLFERFIREGTPHCAANAIVGVTGIRRVAWLGLKPFYRCPAELADSVEAGKDWVVAYKG
jgi:hypothetical protein